MNADGYVSAGQGMNCCNMFIYCENNPVNRLVIAGGAALVCTGAVVGGVKKCSGI